MQIFRGACILMQADAVFTRLTYAATVKSQGQTPTLERIPIGQNPPTACWTCSVLYPVTVHTSDEFQSAKGAEAGTMIYLQYREPQPASPGSRLVQMAIQTLDEEDIAWDELLVSMKGSPDRKQQHQGL
jgi:hypothetical protein